MVVQLRHLEVLLGDVLEHVLCSIGSVVVALEANAMPPIGPNSVASTDEHLMAALRERQLTITILS